MYHNPVWTQSSQWWVAIMNNRFFLDLIVVSVSEMRMPNWKCYFMPTIPIICQGKRQLHSTIRKQWSQEDSSSRHPPSGWKLFRFFKIAMFFLLFSWLHNVEHSYFHITRHWNGTGDNEYDVGKWSCATLTCYYTCITCENVNWNRTAVHCIKCVFRNVFLLTWFYSYFIF